MKRRRRKENDRHSLVSLRERAVQAQGGLCYWCKNPMDQPTADHLVPLHEGGKTRPGNVVAACAKCNNERHPYLNKPPAAIAPKIAISAGDDTPRSPFEVLRGLLKNG